MQNDAVSEQARRAAEHHGSATAALRYFDEIGSRTGWSRDDADYRNALRSLADLEKVAA